MIRADEGAVKVMYLCAIVLHNIRNFVILNPVSQYFDCTPPTIEQWLYHKTLDIKLFPFDDRRHFLRQPPTFFGVRRY